MSNLELHLPDEDRAFELRVKRGPLWGSYASLIRKKVRGQIMFKVICHDMQRCGNATEFFKSSRDAVRKWQVVAILGGGGSDPR